MRDGGRARWLARYRIFETTGFREDLAQLTLSGLSRLNAKLRESIYPRLQEEPHFGPNIKRLKNWDPPTWRYRIGAWRFFFEIDEEHDLVLMTATDHRSSAYDR
jgi:mRNA interferase RelE/StbE